MVETTDHTNMFTCSLGLLGKIYLSEEKACFTEEHPSMYQNESAHHRERQLHTRLTTGASGCGFIASARPLSPLTWNLKNDHEFSVAGSGSTAAFSGSEWLVCGFWKT